MTYKYDDARVPGITGSALLVCLFSAGSVQAQQAPPDAHSHKELEEVVVSAAALERSIEQLAQPTSVLEGNELTTRQSTSIGETLSSQLGVSSTYFGPVASRPVIRGQFGERVRVLTNSLDSLDASALSEDHAVAVDSILAQQIEIVRGPATLLYGSGAAGGLVNVVDDRIVQTPLSEAASGAASVGTDSATGRKSAAAKLAFGNANVAAHLDYYRRDTDSVRIPGFAESDVLRALEDEDADEALAFGSIGNTDSQTDGGAAAITFTGENGYLGVSYSVHDSNYGIPVAHHEEGEEGEEEEEEGPVRISLDQARVDVRGEYNFADGVIRNARLRIASNDYQHVELEGAEVGTVFDTQGTDARVELRHAAFGALEGAFGAQYKQIDFEAVGEEAFVPPSNTEQLSLFGFEEWGLSDHWVLQGSARVEWQTITSPLQSKYDESAFGASVGAIFSFSDELSLSANLVHSERHPNSTELFADGPHLAVSRYELGAVTQGIDLDKELSTNLDLTLRGTNEAIEFSVTAFVNEVDDYILLTQTGGVRDGLPVFAYGQSDVRIWGLESEARIELLDTAAGHLHTRLFGDMVRGEQKDAGSKLPRIPPLRYGAGLHYTRGGLGVLVEAAFHDDQRRTAPNELPTDSYVMLSGEVSYAWPERGLFMFARGTNLADEDARQHTSPLKDVVPLPGRSLQLGIRYDF